MSKNIQARKPILREKSILLGFATQRRSSDGRVEIVFKWGRILASLLTLLAIGWLSFAAVLFLYFKHIKEFDEVSYGGMVSLPFRMDAHRQKMGDNHIKNGLEAFTEGNFQDGLRLLRLGVIRSPKNLEGRAVLAEFYDWGIKRPDIAADLMIKGIENGGIDDLDYVKGTLRLLLRHQMDSQVQDLADRHLPEEPELTEINRTLAFGAANANFLRGNYDRADDYLSSYSLVATLEGILLSARISWDRGSKLSAIAKMEGSIRKFPNSEQLLMQLSRYHREMGDLDEARRYAILRNVVDPLSAAPRLELLYIHNKSGDTEREARETQRMLQQFREDDPALQSLANFAANSGNISLARKTYAEALENEFPVDVYALLLVEAHLVNEDYTGALNFCDELLKERPEWLSQRWAVFNSLRAVASYGTNRPDLGEIYLQDFVDDASNQPPTFLAVAQRLNSIDRPQQARKVLNIAYQRDPTNQLVLSELIRVELSLGNTGNLNKLLTRLLEMRRPQMGLLMEAYRKLGSDRFIFTPDRENLLIQLNAILRENSQNLLGADA